VPTYEYRCDNCDTTFDVVQSFHDDPLTECPTCGSPVRKVFGSVGIVFKGSGFYKTDSRSGGSASKTAESTVPAAKSDSAAGSSGSSGSSGDGSGGSSDSSGSSTPASTPAASSSSSSGGSSSGSSGSGSKGAKGTKGSSSS